MHSLISCLEREHSLLISKRQATHHKLRKSGGAKRDRTVDLLRARQALSQLSYGPMFHLGLIRAPESLTQGAVARRIACYASDAATTYQEILVGLGGLEPPTSPLSGVRSNHLSYRPKLDCVRTPYKRISTHRAC